jgi:hypothetical protein
MKGSAQSDVDQYSGINDSNQSDYGKAVSARSAAEVGAVTSFAIAGTALVGAAVTWMLSDAF